MPVTADPKFANSYCLVNHSVTVAVAFTRELALALFIELITDGIVTTTTIASITITANSSIKVNPFLYNFYIFSSSILYNIYYHKIEY